MKISAIELSNMLNGTVDGNPSVTVDRPSKIEEGGEGTITFLANRKYEQYAYTTDASIMLVEENFQPSKPIKPTLIRVSNVYECIALLLNKFGENQQNNSVVLDERAIIDNKEFIGENVSIGAFSIVSKGAKVGKGSKIDAQVFLGENVVVGKNIKVQLGQSSMDAVITEVSGKDVSVQLNSGMVVKTQVKNIFTE